MSSNTLQAYKMSAAIGLSVFVSALTFVQRLLLFNAAVRDNYFIYQNSISIVTSSLGRFKSSH